MKNVTLQMAAIFLLAIGCSEETPSEIETVTYEVASEFEPYVQEFIDEAAKRGKSIDFSDSGLKVEFSEFPLENANGLCYLGQYHIVIDKENWFRFSERFRSYLLFHELGHCELDRLHRNDEFNDATWKSIMRGDPFNGIQNRVPVPFYGFRRDYYIDELFNQNIPDPNWGNRKFNFDKPLERMILVEEQSTSRVNNRPKDITGDYEFVLEFDLITNGNTRTKLEWGRTGENYYVNIIPNWGFYIGVNLQGLDNDLYYSNNINLVNGKQIESITIRQHEGVEQVFINNEFIFHVDSHESLDYVNLSATDGIQINNQFNIRKYTLSALQ